MNGTSADSQSLAINLDDQNEGDKIKFLDWGFKIDRLFEVAYRFYKRNESKAFHPSFDVRNRMNALILQARYGDHDSGRAPEVGALDFVGKRRQYEWTLLKGMSRTEAMSNFICSLDELCPFFKAHAEAVKISSGYDKTTANERNGTLTRDVDQSKSQSLESSEQLKAIYSSLCRQTQSQFKSYAEKQCPNDLIQQKYLMKSLQEQYFQQYISQMHPELRSSLSTSNNGLHEDNNNIKIASPIPSPSTSTKSLTNTTPYLTGCEKIDAIPPIGLSLDHSFNTPMHVAGVTSQIQDLSLKNDSPNAYDRGFLPTADVSNKPRIESVESRKMDAKEEASNLIETDISCEELNGSNPEITETVDLDPNRSPDMIQLPAGETNRNTIFLPPGEKKSNLSEPPPPQPPPTRKSHPGPVITQAEHFRMYQSNDLSPIAPFESFPEPKPVQSSSQISRTPIVGINPNFEMTRQQNCKPQPNLAGLDEKPASEKVKVLDYSKHKSQTENVCQTVSTGRLVDEASSLLGATVAPPKASNDHTGPQIIESHPKQTNSQHRLFDLPLPPFSDNKSQALETVVSSATEAVVVSTSSQNLDDKQPSFTNVGNLAQGSDLSHGLIHETQVYVANEFQQQDRQPPEPWGCASSDDGHCDSPSLEPRPMTEPHEYIMESRAAICEPASTWSKKGVSEFKDSVSDDPQSGIYEVKEGTLVVIQVPTYPNGRFIYWEFATDDYDIGFGLDFVFETNLIQPLAVSIYEEDDDEDDELAESANDSADKVDAPYWSRAHSGDHLDPEAAASDLLTNSSPTPQALMSIKARRLANTMPIVPTYRRDSHEEIFSGRHRYPGKGYYLLKFDNTYSVLRSKTLYFRICYFI